MKTKYIYILFALLLPACDKDTDDPEPPAEVPALVIDHISAPALDILNPSAGLLVIENSDGSWTLGYNSVSGKVPRIAVFSEGGFLESDHIAGDTGMMFTALIPGEGDEMTGSFYCEADSSLCVKRFNGNSTSLWSLSLRGGSREASLSILPDGNICLVHTRNTSGYLSLISPAGDSLSSRSVPFVMPRHAAVAGSAVFEDGSCLLAFNYSDSLPDQHHALLCRIDPGGGIIWMVQMNAMHLSFPHINQKQEICASSLGEKSGIVLLSAGGSFIRNYQYSENISQGTQLVNEDYGAILCCQGLVCAFDPGGQIITSSLIFQNPWENLLDCRLLIRCEASRYKLFAYRMLPSSCRPLLVTFHFE
jgi:hypothetical protein